MSNADLIREAEVFLAGDNAQIYDASLVRSLVDALKAAEAGTEWEYGATHTDPERPVTTCATLPEARDAQTFYDREIERHGHGDRSNLFRRTKAVPAGPWVPVQGENE